MLDTRASRGRRSRNSRRSEYPSIMEYTIRCADRRNINVSDCGDGIYLAVRAQGATEWAVLTEQQAEELLQALQEILSTQEH
jgi:hypothetical protein